MLDFDEENRNYYAKYDVTVMTEQNFEALLLWIRTDLESPKSRTSEGQQSVRGLRSESVHLQASAVPTNLTRDLEAKFEKPKGRDSKVFEEI